MPHIPVIRRRIGNNTAILQQQLKLEGIPSEPVPMTVAEVRDRLEKGQSVVLLDVRSRKEWEESAVKLPGAKRAPVTEIENYVRSLPKDSLIVPYCT